MHHNVTMGAEPDAVPCQCHASVLLVSTAFTDWDVTSAMVTVNSTVAQCLTSGHNDIRIHCTVVDFQDSIPAEVRALAEQAHVRLIGCDRPRRAAPPKKDWLTHCWLQHYPHLVNGQNFSHVIGYFPETAKTALLIRDVIRRRGADCRCVLVVTDSHRVEPIEESARLINRADAVYSLGPLLFREFTRHVNQPHWMVCPMPRVSGPVTSLTPHTSTLQPTDIITFYPEHGIPRPDEEYQYKLLVSVIKAISNVAKSYFGQRHANTIEWHIYSVPEDRSVREQLKAVIQEHSVFAECIWRLHNQPTDIIKVLQMAALCVCPWQRSYDPNALYTLLCGVPTLLCASSGVAEMLFNDVARADDDSALLTARAVVNYCGDSEDNEWMTKIEDIINSPLDARAAFLQLGSRVQRSAALREGMSTFSVTALGGQVVQPPSELTALGPVSTGGMETPMSPSTQPPGQPGHVGRPLRGRRVAQTHLEGSAARPSLVPRLSQEESGASPGPGPQEQGSSPGPGPQEQGSSPGPGPQEQIRGCRISVKPWTDVSRYNQLVVDSENVYQMTASPRGIALIVNINKIRGMEEARNGSEVDERNLCNLFTQLNFSCITKTDLSRQEILDELNKLVSSEELCRHDCVVVCLMSHGQEGMITASDNRHIALTEVCNILSRCDALKGKPKLVIIQACRGVHTHGGETRTDGPTDNLAAIKPPVMSDMLVVYPSSLGYKSYRNTAHGSWLITCLVQVFSEHACNEHVSELLTRVMRKVSQMETSGTDVVQGNMEQPEAHLVLRKLLYFFPGM